VDLFNFRINDMSSSQSIDVPLTDKYTTNIDVEMVHDNIKDSSDASLGLSVKNFLSQKAWVEVTTKIGSNSGISIRGFRNLTQRW
jgi:hypothetical protein